MPTIVTLKQSTTPRTELTPFSSRADAPRARRDARAIENTFLHRTRARAREDARRARRVGRELVQNAP
jgi:hypothetical protein